MFNYQHWLLALLLLFAFSLNWVLFLLPGCAAAVFLGARRKVAPVYLVILVITTTATLGYSSFWIFFASRTAGKIFTFFIYIPALLVSARRLLQPGYGREVARQAAVPFLLALLIGICYVSLFYLFGDPHHDEAGLANARFFEEGQAGDNIIPLIFAGRIYGHEPLHPFCCGDWLSSDRPPLQAGLFLLLRPLRIVPIGLDYQLLATALQCSWVCGAWCLLTVLGTSRRYIKQIIVILACSGFFFYNSVYPWPKLLAAACILFLASVLCDIIRTGSPPDRFQTVLAAVCLGLAFMAHPGSVFSMPAFALIFWRYRRLFPALKIGLAICIVLAFILPWSAYQKFVDPPGNRLVKMHLAGLYSVDSRSLRQSITDAYRVRGWREILKLKWSNLTELFGEQPLRVLGLNSFQLRRSEIMKLRIAQREWVWDDIGLLNVGWLGILWMFLKLRRGTPGVPYSGRLLAAPVLNLVVWSLVMFGPEATLARHSSYADLILLSLGLCGYLLTLPAMVVFFVLILELWNLLAVWTWFPPVTSFPQQAKIEVPFLLSGALALGALLWILVRAFRDCDNPEHQCAFFVQ